MHRIFESCGELIRRPVWRLVVVAPATARVSREQLIAKHRRLSRGPVPEDRGTVSMCAFVCAAVLPAQDDMAVEWYAISDEKTVQRGTIAVRSWWVIAARWTAQQQQSLNAIIPVLTAQAPLFCASHLDLRRLVIVNVDMGITFKVVIGDREVDDRADNLPAPCDIQEGHILAWRRGRHAGECRVKCAPPTWRFGKWLVAHAPGNMLDRLVGCDHDTGGRGEGHQPVEIEIHGGAATSSGVRYPTLHQRATPWPIDARAVARD